MSATDRADPGREGTPAPGGARREAEPGGGADAPAGRRGVLGWLIGGFLSLWGVGAAVMGVAFLRAPGSEHRTGERVVRCGPFSSLPVGQARLIRHGAQPLYVVRVSETQAVALSAVCTHVRCVLRWDDAAGRLDCPCHDGAFDRSGNVLAGPPRRPLAQYPVEIRADEIVVRV